MSSRRLLRLLVAGAVTAAPALVAAPAAHADGGGLVLSAPTETEVWQYETLKSPHSTDAVFEVGKAAGAPLANYRLTVDASGAAGVATVDASALSWQVAPYGNPCPTKDGRTTCSTPAWSESAAAFDAKAFLRLTALPGAHPGTTGTIHISESADGVATRTADLTVKITEGEPELDVAWIPAVLGVKPGSSVPASLTVTNLGPVPATRLVVEAYIVHGLTAAPRFSNCEYAGTTATTDIPDEQDVICTVDQTVNPGESYRLDLGSLGVTQDALDPWMYAAVGTKEDDTARSWRGRSDFHPGSGPALAATSTDRPTKQGDYFRSFGALRVGADNTADFRLTGDWKATDSTGLHGTLTVTFENRGPGAYMGAQGLILPANTKPTFEHNLLNSYISFRLPHGGRVVQLPEQCSTGLGMPEGAQKEDVQCGRGETKWMPKGFRTTFRLGIDLPDGAQGAPLTLTTNWAGPDTKSHPSTTTITLGEAGASDSPTPGTSDSSSPTLAFTGASGIGTMTAVGVGAVALGGGVLYLTTRRRRSGTHQ